MGNKRGTDMKSKRKKTLGARLALLTSVSTPMMTRPALAASFVLPENSGMIFAAAGGLMALAASAWAWIVVRKLNRDNRKARQRLAELEDALSESEALLAAEPHAMVVWEGREEKPRRISARLHMIPGVPRNEQDLLNFEGWMDDRSARAVREALKSLRATGQPFNISFLTRGGELLEADGRAAGYTIVLRFRPVFGERRDAMEMVSDTRRLGEQIARLSGLLDTAPMPVWLRDEEGRLLWANKAWLEATESPDVNVAAASGVVLAAAEDMRVLREDKEKNARLLRASTVIRGKKRILDIHELDNELGRVYWAVDITENENLRRELSSHIDAHTGTLDKLYTAIAIFGPGQQLVFSNRAYADLWGLDATWLDTRPAENDILNRLRDMGKLPVEADFRKWKEDHLSIYTALEGRESKWHLPDGRTLRVVAEPHPQGGVIYIFEDITEKLRLEGRYKELLDVQKETLDNLHEGIALFGTDGRLRLYNPAYAGFWNAGPELLDNSPHIDALIAHCRPLVRDDAWWDSLKYCVTGMSEARKILKGRIRRTDERVFDYVIVPLPDGNTLTSWFDVSDAAKAERALRERNEALAAADRLKGDFLGSVSYVLRTPLTSIIGFSEALDMNLAGELNGKQREYIRDIRASSEDLLGVIDTILDLNTIDAGQMELKIEPLDTASLLQEAASAMADRLERRNLTVQLDLADDAAIVHADRVRIGQILSKLLSNAIGFSDSGGVIHMGARRVKDGVEVWVADEGAGMDAETVKSAFDRFSSRPSAGGHRGPGLGLPLVKSLVKLHGGSVRIASEVGKGTSVICHFPFAAADVEDGQARVS